ncbi:Rap30/74 interaction domain-containing protein [Massarina eburnea CBS 473.64]|uniref:Rap30/74 interaction domain-containing protein n=1 Tax=Massarina eburnea CBS 473.64 TaxID=1395130 RepID=A0A6A6SE73_9PLEO|nr:Rap30/74 interaction domain-containing protein [Massarina eburnea CBS 473.64]
MAGESQPVPANGAAALPRRRKPRPSNNPLRAPRRPLKSITKPVMSLTRMNERELNAPGAEGKGPVAVDTLRNEMLSQGARSMPLVVSRKDLRDLRHHVMRLQLKDRVDLQNEEQFTPPIRLHRRDPRAPPSGAGAQYADDDNKEDIEESKERERMEIMREERRKVREENQAKIAPSGIKKQPAFQKKTEQKYRPDDTPEAKKRMLLKYEETLPWHLEDFDNKQTWVGTYESELSDAHVMLTSDGQAVHMVPLERWYRFSVKSKAKSTEDPDVKDKGSAYFTRLENRIKEDQVAIEKAKAARGMRTRVGGGGDDTGRIKRAPVDDDTPYIKHEADADDIDFDAQEDFADDEEGLNGLFEGEEQDVKEAAEKLKRDQLAAAAFDLRDEDEIEREEKRALEEKEQARLLEKAVRKSLIKREKNIDYETDEENPYASESDSDTDSETERQRAKEEEEKKAAEQNKAPEGEKPASGASTKGANTPSGNHRPVDVNKKKRPGSPNLSEASGNESSRKKHKKKHSEKLKARIGNTPAASPSGSRAGSPAAQVNGSSRPGSPTASGASSSSRLPSAIEIHQALPPEGMNIRHLINKFKDRVDKATTPAFIRLVKVVSSFDKDRNALIPLPQMPSQEQIDAATRPPKAKTAGNP